MEIHSVCPETSPSGAENDLKLYNLKEIRKAIAVLFSDVHLGAGECIEVRLLDKRKKLVVSGWFDDLDLLAKRVALAARDGVGSPGSYRFIQDNVYWTVNPINDALLSRQPKNILDFVSENSSDNNATRRCWFPIDVDPIRPSGVSATKEERKLALDVINTMVPKLEELGFTDNMYVGGTSGNGFHCLIRVDLPNDDDSRDLLRDCLKSLNMLVGTAKVEIDPKVFNAARIIKAYGTMARKGVNDEKRPWHMSKLTYIPEQVEVAPRELLEKLAALAPKGGNPKRAVEDKPQGPWTEENLQKYIAEGTDWGCVRRDGKKANEVCQWIGRCVNDDTHDDAAIIRMRTAKHTVDLVRRGSLEVCGIVSCGPCDRREIGDELDGHVCQSGQDLMKVFADRDAKPAAALDHGEDRGHTRSGLFAADVDPVFSAQRYAAHGVFRQVVAKFQFRIFEEAGQFLP